MWNKRFIELAYLVASWSKDPSTKVGAVIVNNDNIILSIGFNGFPKGVPDRDEDLNNRSVKYKLTVHAELNAILNSNNSNMKNSTLYVTHFPCNECVKSIVQSGITRIVYSEKIDPSRFDDTFSNKMLSDSKIEVIHHEG